MKKKFSLLMAVLLIVSNCLFVFADEQPLGDKLLTEQITKSTEQILEDKTENIETPLLDEDIINNENLEPAEGQDEGLHTEISGLEQEITPFVYDDQPPELIGEISIDKTEVEAPGVITVTTRAKDNLSGIDYFFIHFNGGKKDFHVFMENKFYDQFQNKYVEYPDNIFKGTIKIDDYDTPSIYSMSSINIVDNTKNIVNYTKSPYIDDFPLPNNLSFTIINTRYDDEAPKIIGEIIIDKTEIEAPGIVTVTTKATDNLSGINMFRLNFKSDTKTYSVQMENQYYDKAENKYIQYPDNIFKGTIKIDTYDVPSICNLYSIELDDNSGNRSYYLENPYNDELPLPINLSFKIINVIYDDEPPVVDEITIDKIDIEAPGIITVTAKATDNLSGIQHFYIDFKSSNRNYTTYMENKYYDELQHKYIYYPDNIFKGKILIGTYDVPLVYSLDYISIMDTTRNEINYRENPYENDLPLPNNLSFTVLNDNPADLATNTDNPNIVDDIKSQPDDALILINYSTGSEVDTNIFEAIKGTDKTIVFQGNGIEWVFNGKDIDNPKDINLNVGINLIDNYYSNNSNGIEEIVKDVPTIVLSFPENGVLPGKSKIRVKADYTFKNYLGLTDLYVYYYDNTNEKLVPIASSINVSEADEYLEFEILHNSDFIITKGEVPLVSPNSELCDILSVRSPNGATLSEENKTISYNVPYNRTSQYISVDVSPYANWKLYSDANCKVELDDSFLTLKEGLNSFYIKVTAKNGTTNKIYTVNINREYTPTPIYLCDIIAVRSPNSATFSETSKTINYKVGYQTTSQLINVIVSDEATWKLYSDYSCKNEIKDKYMFLNVGSNTAYIKVTSKNGISSKIYTVTITREASNTNGGSSNSSSSSNSNLPSSTSTNNTTTTQPSLSKPVTFIDKVTTSKTIQDTNTKNQSPKIVLREDLKSAIFDGKDLLTNATSKHDLIFANGNISVNFTPTLVEQLKLNDTSKVEVMLYPLATSLNTDLVKAITNIDPLNKDLIKANYVLKLLVDDKEVTDKTSPIMITIKNIARTLTEQQQNNFTGALFDTDLKKYVQLGGEFDNYNSSFSFYTNQLGTFGAIISNNLTKVKLKVDNKYYNINNKTYTNDVAPIISNDRVMLPLRLIAETLNANVSWNQNSGVATVTKNNKTIELEVNKPLENDMGTPIILNNRTYVPIRYIAEILGANIVWNSDAKEIDIYQ